MRAACFAKGDFATMDHSFIKIGAALVASALLACPAHAVSPLSLNNTPSLLVPIEDEENEEVWRDLRPDITPPEAAAGKTEEAPKPAEPEQRKEEGSGDIEEKELKKDGVIPE
jgi:hypothetical protein